MTVLVVDYGMGNLASARRALEECGARVNVSADPGAVSQADRLVIPGVGAFAEAMHRLSDRGWVEVLRGAAIEARLPMLGICLGMQLLADEGDEGGRTAGLGLIPGKVRRMQPASNLERVPHVGWNEVQLKNGSGIFADIPDRADFYFVHSYRFEASADDDIAATVDYCGQTVAAVARSNVTGVQFHPEKSSRAGLRLLRNFLALPC